MAVAAPEQTTYSMNRRIYTYQATHVTNISKDYLTGETSWDAWAVLRECVQNALDEAEYMANTYSGTFHDYIRFEQGRDRDFFAVADKGRGVAFDKILLLGFSEKRGTQYRGEKGEGQLMAFLVALKLGIELRMSSQNWMAKPRFVPFNGPGSYEVLALDVYETTTGKPIEGSMWKFYNAPEILKLADRLNEYFPDLDRQGQRKEQAALREDRERRNNWLRRVERREQKERQAKSTGTKRHIFPPAPGKPQRLYLKGIFVRDLKDGLTSLFSYNLDSVAINRDRDMVDQSQLHNEMARLLGSEEVTDKMRWLYWEAAKADDPRSGAMEFRVVPTNVQEADHWLKALRKVYGKRVCLYTNPNAAADALLQDLKPINLTPMAAKFAQSLGIQTDVQVAQFDEHGYKLVQPTSKETRMLELAFEVLEAMGLRVPVVHVVGKMLNDTNGSTLGWETKGEVFLLRKVFEAGSLALLRTLLHEVGHAESGRGDYDRGFEAWLLDLTMALLKSEPKTFAKVQRLLKEMEAVYANG